MKQRCPNNGVIFQSNHPLSRDSLTMPLRKKMAKEKKRKKETPRFKISEKDEKGDAIRDRGSRDDKKRTIAREYFT